MPLKRRSICSFCSSIGCRFIITVEDERPVGIEPDPEVPHHGQGCPRWKCLTEYYYHPERLNFPLKRVGGRGEGKFERISWDQGLKEVAEKLKEIIEKYGAEAVVAAGGTGHNMDYHWSKIRFMNLIGSPNYVGNEQICYGGRTLMDGVSWGQAFPIHIGLRGEQKCIIVTVMNPVESWPTIWYRILQAKKQGTKLIHIDPRFTEVSRNADLWIQVRPGSDSAYLLAWIRMMIKENLCDINFVYNYTNAPFLVRTDENRLLRETDLDPQGIRENFVVWDEISNSPVIWVSKARRFKAENVKPALDGEFEVRLHDRSVVPCKTVWRALKEHVEPYTFEWAEKLTWVSAEKIRQAGEWYAKLKPSIIIGEYVWESQNPYNILAKAILRALSGNVVVGGEVLVPPIPFDFLVGDYELELNELCAINPEIAKKRLGYYEFPLIGGQGYERIIHYQKELYGGCATSPPACQAHPALVVRAILEGKPYPVKAFILAGCGALTKFPNTKLWYEALKKLDLLVVLDMFHNPNTMLADYVFPASHWMERPAIHTFYGNYDFILAGEAALPPLYERRSDYDFWRGLGLAMGQDKQKYWPWKDLKEVCDYRLKRMGFNTLEEFMQKTKGAVYLNIPANWGEKGFATPSGRVEIWPSILEDLKLPTLPTHVEPPESPYSTPLLYKEYPYILITGARHLPFTHSEHRQLPSLRRMHPDPIVEIHPSTARELDPPVWDGDWVWIETPRGRIKQKVRTTPSIHPKVVSSQHCWWFPEKPGSEPSLYGLWESNVNILTDDDPKVCGKAMGNWPAKTLLCKVYKA